MNDIREYLIKQRDEIEQKMLQSEKKTKYLEALFLKLQKLLETA